MNLFHGRPSHLKPTLAKPLIPYSDTPARIPTVAILLLGGVIWLGFDRVFAFTPEALSHALYEPSWQSGFPQKDLQFP